MIIRMQTEQVQQAARQLEQLSLALSDLTDGLDHSVVSMDWSGPSRDEFVTEIQIRLGQFRRLAEEGLTLSRRVQAEVEEWVAVDGQGATLPPRAIGLPPLSLGLPGYLGPSIQPGSPTPPLPIDKLIQEDFDWSSAWAGLFAGLPFDDLAFFVGTWADMQQGESFEQAFFSEMSELLLQIGMQAVPVVGQAAYVLLEVYEATLAVCHGISMLFELAGKTSSAVMLQNALDTLDVTEHFGDGVVSIGPWFADLLQQTHQVLSDPNATLQLMETGAAIPISA